ncbi:MAG TPA: large conductance mechanosensitive channel protein MscL [Solirubrobacteraceae bacterium]
MKQLVADFKSFLIKGDLVSLAVGLVMALVFAAVVKALIADLITPIIALIFGQPDFSTLSFTINSSHFLYGDFINNLITFVTTGAAVFFFVVKPYEGFTARRSTEDPTIKQCPECTTEIPAAATRCPQCTAVLAGAPGATALR